MKPTLEHVTEVLRRLNVAAGWIGEGGEIVSDLLAYIDGENTMIADWALEICPECGIQDGHATWCKARG